MPGWNRKGCCSCRVTGARGGTDLPKLASLLSRSIILRALLSSVPIAVSASVSGEEEEEVVEAVVLMARTMRRDIAPPADIPARHVGQAAALGRNHMRVRHDAPFLRGGGDIALKAPAG